MVSSVGGATNKLLLLPQQQQQWLDLTCFFAVFFVGVDHDDRTNTATTHFRTATQLTAKPTIQRTLPFVATHLSMMWFLGGVALCPQVAVSVSQQRNAGG